MCVGNCRFNFDTIIGNGRCFADGLRWRFIPYSPRRTHFRYIIIASKYLLIFIQLSMTKIFQFSCSCRKAEFSVLQMAAPTCTPVGVPTLTQVSSSSSTLVSIMQQVCRFVLKCVLLITCARISHSTPFVKCATCTKTWIIPFPSILPTWLILNTVSVDTSLLTKITILKSKRIEKNFAFFVTISKWKVVSNSHLA